MAWNTQYTKYISPETIIDKNIHLCPRFCEKSELSMDLVSRWYFKKSNQIKSWQRSFFLTLKMIWVKIWSWTLGYDLYITKTLSIPVMILSFCIQEIGTKKKLLLDSNFLGIMISSSKSNFTASYNQVITVRSTVPPNMKDRQFKKKEGRRKERKGIMLEVGEFPRQTWRANISRTKKSQKDEDHVLHQQICCFKSVGRQKVKN